MNKPSSKNYPTRLAESARHLLSVSSTATDDVVKEARMQLESVLEGGKRALDDARERGSRSLDAADGMVRDNPYALMAIAFVFGIVIAFAAKRCPK